MITVQVLMPAYRHEAFIAQAIDSVLEQRIKGVDLRILISDDGSDDGTPRILREYERRYPERIHVTYIDPATKNDQHDSLPGRRTLIDMYRRSSGTLIALLEGDDYWIDPDKVQAQVDHLLAHPEQSMCFTNAYNEYPGGKRVDYVHSWLGEGTLPTVFGLEDLITHNFIPTAGVVYRKDRFRTIPEAFHTAAVLDWILYLALAKEGGLGFLDRLSAVRRVHPGGVISMKDLLITVDRNLDLLRIVNGMTDGRFADRLLERRGELDRMAIQHAVDTDRPALGAKYLRDLLGHPVLRRATGTKELLRSGLLVHAPALAKLYHSLRAGRS